MSFAAKCASTRLAQALVGRSAVGLAWRTAQVPASSRAFSSENKTIDEFVKESLEKCGLEQFADETLKQLKDAQVINTNLLFRLSDSDLKMAGLSVGASRALKDAIAEVKRVDIVARSGERAQVRRALSMKEKRGF